MLIPFEGTKLVGTYSNTDTVHRHLLGQDVHLGFSTRVCVHVVADELLDVGTILDRCQSCNLFVSLSTLHLGDIGQLLDDHWFPLATLLILATATQQKLLSRCACTHALCALAACNEPAALKSSL